MKSKFFLFIVFYVSIFASCRGTNSVKGNDLNKIEEAKEIVITVQPQREHIRLKSFEKNYLKTKSGTAFKDVRQKIEELFEFEEKWELRQCTKENSNDELREDYIFVESEKILCYAGEIVAGIKKSEDEDMVHLKIHGDVQYEIGFIDPINGYVKERIISNSFAIAKKETTYELFEKVYKWAVEEKEGEKYIFANEGFCGGRRNSDKRFVENVEDGKMQPVVKLSPRDCVIWCNAYSEMQGLTPVYYKGAKDIEDLTENEIESLILRDATKGIFVDSAKLLTSKQAKKPNGKNGYRLPLPDEWELSALLTKDSGNRIEKYSVNVNGEEWYFTKSDSASGAKANYKNAEECNRVAWYKASSNSKTHPVGTLQANDLGIYDMSGNVSEWCFAFNSSGHYLFRGGDWFNGASTLQLGYFNFFFPNYADVNLGFRVARTID